MFSLKEICRFIYIYTDKSFYLLYNLFTTNHFTNICNMVIIKKGEENMSKEKTKVCKYCKEEIDAKAKVCPHCQKKQGGKLKWVIIIIIVLAVLGMAMGGGDDDSSSTDSQTKSTTAAKKETAKKAETKEKDSVKVGESFENDGLKVTAKKAEFGYDAGEYFTPKDGCEYVAVDFTCENIAEKCTPLHYFRNVSFFNLSCSFVNIPFFHFSSLLL